MDEPAKRSGVYKEILVLFALAAVVIVAFAFPLFQGGLFFDSDSTTEDYPMYAFYGKALREGGQFWWNPYYLAGYPSYLSAAFNMLDPVNLVLFRFMEDPLTAHTTRVVIDSILSVALSYAFARVTGLSRIPSIVVGFSYLVGFSLPHMTQNLMGSGSTFVLPGLLLAAYKLRFSERWLSWMIAGGIFWGFSWLHAFANYVFNFSVVAFLYALYLDIAYPRVFGWRVSRFRTTCLTIGAGAIGVIVGLPFILPAALFRPLTQRVAGFGLSDLDGISIADPLNFFFPDYVRLPMLSSSGALYGFYIGGLGLIAAGLGFIAMRSRERIWYGGMYLLALFLTIRPLGLSWLLLQIPVFSYFHTMRRWLLAGVFFLAYAAGYGIHALLSDEEFRNRPAVRRYLFWAGVVMGLVILGAVGLNVLFYLLPWSDPQWHASVFQRILPFISVSGSYPETYYASILAKLLFQVQRVFSLLNWTFFVPFLFLPAGFFLIALLVRGKMTKSAFARGVLVLASLNFVLYYIAQLPLLVDRTEYERAPLLADFLKKREPDPAGYRLMSFLTGDTAFKKIRAQTILSNTEDYAIMKELLTPNVNMFFEIPRVEGYEPYWTQRQIYVWRKLVRNEDPQGESAAQAEQFVRWLPLLSAYNVKYILSGYSLEHPDLSETAFRSNRFPELGLRLYENRSARPRVRTPGFVRVVRRWDDAYFDLYRIGGEISDVVECPECEEGAVLGDADAEIRNIRYVPGAIEFTVTARRPSWVVVAESHLPGWKAKIDDKEAPIRTANYLTQAVMVPAGEHSVQLAYRGIVWEKLDAYGQ